MKINKFKKKEIVSILFILISLITYTFFPVKDNFQQMVTMFVFFVVLPLLFNFIFLKNKISFYGISVGDWKKGLIYGCASIFIVGVLLFIATNYFDFLNKRAVPELIANDFWEFVFYELVVVAFFVAVYEFYFRGFIMPIFAEIFGRWAILIQAAIFFSLILFIGGASMFLFLPYLLFSLFGGLIVQKSRSLIYSGIAQLFLIIILDAVSIRVLG